MSPLILHRVLHGTTTPSPAQSAALTIRPAVLDGHTRHRVKNCDYPAVVSDPDTPGACVRGTWVDGLTLADVWRLDIFEGEQYERRRVRCRIIADEGQDGGDRERQDVRAAETYIWIESRDKLEPREWDFDEFRREKIGRWIGREEFAGELRPAIRGTEGFFVSRLNYFPSGGLVGLFEQGGLAEEFVNC